MDGGGALPRRRRGEEEEEEGLGQTKSKIYFDF
jgi:hypothetical protein